MTDDTTDTVISVLKWKPDEMNLKTRVECQAEYIRPYVIKHVELEYVFEPRVTINPLVSNNVKCNTLYLTCDWVANPEDVKIAWFVNGARLKNVTKHLIITKQQLLQGHQIVACEATNQVGTSRHEVNHSCKYFIEQHTRVVCTLD